MSAKLTIYYSVLLTSDSLLTLGCRCWWGWGRGWPKQLWTRTQRRGLQHRLLQDKHPADRAVRWRRRPPRQATRTHLPQGILL